MGHQAGLLALPTLLIAEHSPDPEVRARARLLASPYASQWQFAGREVYYVLLAYDLTYGDPDVEPWLPRQKEGLVRADPLATYYVWKLYKIKGLLKDNGTYDAGNPDGRVGFVHVMRFRAAGLPDPK